MNCLKLLSTSGSDTHWLAPLSQQEWSAITLSFQVALVSVLVVLLPGILIGWALSRFKFPGRTLVETFLHLPLILPPVVIGYLLLIMLGKNGPLGAFFYEQFGWQFIFTWKAAVIASAVMGFPLLVRSVKLAMELIDRRMEQAAATLGASPLHSFLTITLPLALPGIIAGMVLCFARSMGEFGATITFAGNIQGQTQTLPLAIYTTIQQPGQDIQSWRLVLLSVLIAVVAMLGAEIINRIMKQRMGVDSHD